MSTSTHQVSPQPAWPPKSHVLATASLWNLSYSDIPNTMPDPPHRRAGAPVGRFAKARTLGPDPSDRPLIVEAKRCPFWHQVGDTVEPARDHGSLRQVLDQLKAAFDDLRAGYPDVARRERAWSTFRGLAVGPLWDAVEDSEDDRWRALLVDVLDAAVSRLDAFQLERRHISALERTLSRLGARDVTEDDVDACENAWREVGVNTVLSLTEGYHELV